MLAPLPHHQALTPLQPTLFTTDGLETASDILTLAKDIEEAQLPMPFAMLMQVVDKNEHFDAVFVPNETAQTRPHQAPVNTKRRSKRARQTRKEG